MEPRINSKNIHSSSVNAHLCGDCTKQDGARLLKRREFLTAAGGAVLGATALGSVLPAGRVWAKAKAEPAAASAPESLVKVLYEALSPKQREIMCFDWEYVDKDRGLLRTRVANNWEITKKFINDKEFYTDDQRIQHTSLPAQAKTPSHCQRTRRSLNPRRPTSVHEDANSATPPAPRRAPLQ
jgi:hypothetical protein